MSLTSCTTVCNAMPEFLETLTGAASPYAKRQDFGAVAALISEYNTMNSIAPRVDLGNGQRRAVDVFYIQRATEADVNTQAPVTCDFDDQCYLSSPFDIALYADIRFKVKERYMAEMCGGDGDQFARMLLSKFNALVQKMDKAVLTQLLAGAGNNVNTGAATEVTKDILDANGKINADKLEEYLFETEVVNKFNDKSIVIGAGTSWRANKLLQVGCCFDGTDIAGIAAQVGWAHFTDTNATSVLGNADSTLVLEPGAAKLATWYPYRDLAGDVLKSDGAMGAFQMADGTMRGIMRDPVTQIPFNIKIMKDSCTDAFNIVLSINFDVWTMPTDVYAAGDSFSGYTGILKYKFT